VQNVVGATAGLLCGFAIGDAALDEVNFVADVSQIGELSGREVVEHGHAVVAADQFIDRVGANESGSTCNEIPHRRVPPRNFRLDPIHAWRLRGAADPKKPQREAR
jgi:hypothetical protein